MRLGLQEPSSALLLYHQGMISLRQLQYLVAAADAGSVNGAARALEVSQPVVSRSLHNLERDYHVALFHLSGRRLALTDAGRAVVASARIALGALEDVERTALHGGLRAELVVATTPTNGALLSPIVTEFVKCRPETSLRLTRADDIDEVCSLVDRGEADLGFGDVVDCVSAAKLCVQPLWEVSVVLVSPVGTDLPSAVSLHRLAKEPLVLPRSSSGRRRLIDNLLTVAAGEPPTPALVTDERAAWISSAQQGVGSFLSYRVVAETLPGVELRSLDPPHHVGIGFAYRPGSLSNEGEELMRLARSCPTLTDRDGIAAVGGTPD